MTITPKYKTKFKLPNGIVEIDDVRGEQREHWRGLMGKPRVPVNPYNIKLTDTPRTYAPWAYKAGEEYLAQRIALWALWRARSFGLIPANLTPGTAKVQHDFEEGFRWLVTFEDFMPLPGNKGDCSDRPDRVLVLVPDWPEAGDVIEEQLDIVA